jgi:hypothetical protein
MGFYDFDEYERLVAAAKGIDPTRLRCRAVGGEAGLPLGEIVALE